MNCRRRCALMIIQLSPYQHPCFIVLLNEIPNICRFYPYFSMLFCCQFVCTPNDTTAEPDLPRTPSETQRENGWKIISRWSPGARKMRDMPASQFGSYSVSLNIRASAVFVPSRGGRIILCSYEVSTISKYNFDCISYNLIG